MLLPAPVGESAILTFCIGKSSVYYSSFYICQIYFRELPYTMKGITTNAGLIEEIELYYSGLLKVRLDY
jgi:hypothetical protein